MRQRRLILAVGLLAVAATVWATPGNVTLTLPVDTDPSQLSIRLNPGDQRIIRIMLTESSAAINTNTFTSFTLYLKNAAGATLTTKTLTTVSPTTSGIVTCTTDSDDITSAVTQGGVGCTTGSLKVVCGPFKVLVPKLATW